MSAVRNAVVGCVLLFGLAVSVHAQSLTDDTADSYVNLEPKSIRSDDVLRDPELKVESRKLGLRRKVEMLQWTREGGEYVKVWRDSHVPDEGFDDRHRNPSMPNLRNAVWLAKDATIDGKPVEASVLMALGQWIDIRPSFSRVPYRWSLRFQPEGDGMTDSDNPLEPEVGDVRLSWAEMFVPTLERQVVLANGVWQLPENLQLDAATRQELIEQRDAASSRLSWNNFLTQLWWQSALALLVFLIGLRLFVNWRHRHKKKGQA